jgi:hypothetical protein
LPCRALPLGPSRPKHLSCFFPQFIWHRQKNERKKNTRRKKNKKPKPKRKTQKQTPTFGRAFGSKNCPAAPCR